MSNGNEGEWYWSSNEEDYHGGYGSKDEALLEAFMDNPDTQEVWVGKTQEVPLAQRMGAYQVVEHIVSNILDEAPEMAHDGAWGGSLLEPDLLEEFKQLVVDFINKHEPPWWSEIGDLEKVLKIDWEEE